MKSKTKTSDHGNQTALVAHSPKTLVQPNPPPRKTPGRRQNGKKATSFCPLMRHRMNQVVKAFCDHEFDLDPGEWATVMVESNVQRQVRMLQDFGLISQGPDLPRIELRAALAPQEAELRFADGTRGKFTPGIITAGQLRCQIKSFHRRQYTDSCAALQRMIAEIAQLLNQRAAESPALDTLLNFRGAAETIQKWIEEIIQPGSQEPRSAAEGATALVQAIRNFTK